MPLVLAVEQERRLFDPLVQSETIPSTSDILF